MCNLTGFTTASIWTIAREAGCAIVFGFVAVGAVGVITGLAVALRGFESRFAGFAIIGVDGAVDAVDIFAGKYEIYEQKSND